MNILHAFRRTSATGRGQIGGQPVTGSLPDDRHNRKNESQFREPAMLSPVTAPTAQTPNRTAGDTRLREAAEKLEAQFLAEMLKHAGLGETKGEFSGGIGETQFASFLREAQAEEMVRAGGIGLAESLFEAMKERINDAG
ncbi:MAG: rod-binding protein [Rhodovulum sp.]